jgi:DNA-binding MarR family transcriptional regulator
VTIDRSTLVEAVRTCACFNLRRTSRAVTRLFDGALERCGLRSTGFLILVAVEMEGEPTLPRLSRMLGVDRSTLTRNLKPLIDGGLVKTATPAGTRATRARLTKQGQRLLARCVPAWAQAQGQVEARVGKDQWQTTLTALSSLASL